MLTMPSAFADTGITVGSGIDYSSGKYGGTSSTDILYVPVYAKYEGDTLGLKVTVPYLRITSPGTVIIVGDRPVAVSSPSAPRTTESGLGDVVLAGTWSAYNNREAGVLLDVVGKLKLPTADESKGLGTGKTDYALQLDAVKQWGSLSALATVGYRWMGNPPGIELKDVWYASSGFAYKLRPETSVGLLYDYRQRTSTNGSPQSEITAYVSQRVSSHTKLQLYAIGGFADGSPDWGAGLMIAQTF
jgi:hypothetical protein